MIMIFITTTISISQTENEKTFFLWNEYDDSTSSPVFLKIQLNL